MSFAGATGPSSAALGAASKAASGGGAAAAAPKDWKAKVPKKVIKCLTKEYSGLNNTIANLEQKNMNLKAGYSAAQREFASA